MSATPIPLTDASSFDALSRYYSPESATAIASVVTDFMTYIANFPETTASWQQHGGSTTLRLGTNITITRSPQGPPSSLHLAIDFPTNYPTGCVKAALLVQANSQERLKQPHSVIAADGSILVENLMLLRGQPRPYSLLNVLLGISEQFEMEYPLTNAPLQQKPNIANVAVSIANPQRAALLNQASETTTIELNERAAGYLKTRQESLALLQKLNSASRDMRASTKSLTERKQQLEQCLPAAGSISTLLTQLKDKPNTREEHLKCLQPADATQSQLLNLMADLRASDDTIALLEEGLKNEHISIDDYVKYVSDAAREQFAVLFTYCQLIDRVRGSGKTGGGMPSRNPSPPSCASGPNVPKRLSALESLQQQFPGTDASILADVLSNANGDVLTARTMLKGNHFQ